MTRDRVLDVRSKLPNAVEDYPFGDACHISRIDEFLGDRAGGASSEATT